MEELMHSEVTKALYEMFPEDEKNDFYHAYMFLKHPDHFVYYFSQLGGLPAERPNTKLDDDVDAMIQAAVRRISETAATHDTSTYHLKVIKLRGQYFLLLGKFSTTQMALQKKIRLAEELGINGRLVRIHGNKMNTYIFGE